MKEENERRADEILHLTETLPTVLIEEELFAGVILAAIAREGNHPGMLDEMLQALGQGAKKTREGTMCAFLFQSMVDCLLEEYHNLNKG